MINRQHLRWATAAAFILLASRVASADGKIQCDAPKFDFGTKAAGSVVSATFTLTNTGDAPITVTKLEATWGGGGKPPAITIKKIAAGGTATVSTTFNLFGKPGPSTRTITVDSDDPVTPRLQLEIAGTITSAVTVTPALLDFGTVKIAGAKPQTVVISAPDGAKKFVVKTATIATRGLFEVNVTPAADGRSYSIAVTPRPDALPQTFKGTLSIHTDSRAMGTVSVNLTATLQGDVVVKPLLLKVTRGADGVGKTDAITVTPASGAAPFKITSVETPRTDISSTITPMADGGYQIQLGAIPKDADVGKEFVVIHTDCPSAKDLSLPLVDTLGTGAALGWGPVTEGLQMTLELQPTGVDGEMHATLRIRNITKKMIVVPNDIQMVNIPGTPVSTPIYTDLTWVVTNSKHELMGPSALAARAAHTHSSGAEVAPGDERSFVVSPSNQVDFTAAGTYTMKVQLAVPKLKGKGKGPVVTAVLESNTVTVETKGATEVQPSTQP